MSKPSGRPISENGLNLLKNKFTEISNMNQFPAEIIIKIAVSIVDTTLNGKITENDVKKFYDNLLNDEMKKKALNKARKLLSKRNNKISQEVKACLLNYVSPSSIKNIENKKPLSDEILDLIAKFIDVPVAEIVDNFSVNNKEIIRDENIDKNIISNNFLTENQKIISKVFIACAPEDAKIAKQVKRKLEQNKLIKSWTANEDWQFGENRDEAIKREVKNSNYAILVLSENARINSEISRIIGFIDKINKASDMNKKIIIGLEVGDRQSSCLYQIQDFETGEYIGEYNFEKERNFNLEMDLENILLPRVDFIENLEDDEQERLFDESIPVYHNLFPIEAERDPESNIEIRIEKAQQQDPNWRWKDHYFVLRLLNRVIGMGYFSSQLDRKWCFGNYFGILPDYRVIVKAQLFFSKIKQKLNQDNPGLKGIIFEIEKPDLEFLTEKVINLTESQKDSMKNDIHNIKFQEYREKFITNVRRLQRMNIFMGYKNTYILVKRESSDSPGRPFPYKQPGMKIPLEDNVVEDLMPIVHLFDNDLKNDKNLFQDVINFLYQDVFSSELFPEFKKDIFESHVREIAAEIQEHIKDSGFVENDVDLDLLPNQRTYNPKQIKILTADLIKLAKRWQIDREIKL